ncbi:TetR family transcriptional regulator C-terminal domain-containing protein [Mucilaginibacter sp.]|uniref:TetR family transcriptional regulator C-terminal domain-containing protein n=1 Tax=Mucilaginibacter sp. TaxID=1882438 RepID=UPI003565CD2E
MNKATSKAERTKNFIIESTAEIFNKKGFAGTSLSDLTEATGLTKGSIYGNFENKEEVALAVFDYNYARIAKLTIEQVEKAATYHDKLMVYAKVYKNITRSPINRGGCPILNTAIEADDTNGLLKERAAKAVLKWQNSLNRLIEQGIKAGEFREDVDVKQTAVSIIALIEGGVMIARITNDHTSMDNVVKTIELLIKQIQK